MRRAEFTLDVNSRSGVEALDRFSQSAERAARQGLAVERSAREAASGGISILGVAAGTAAGQMLQRAGAAALGAAKDFAVSGVQIAVARESIQSGLAAILGSAEDAERAMEMIRKAAAKPGLTFDTATQGLQKLLSVGYELEPAVEMIELFGNAAALSGARADEMGNALTQYTQAIAKGKFDQQDLNSILQTFPAIGEQIIKVFGGRTAEAINKASGSAEAMAAKMKLAFQGLAEAPETTRQALDNLQDAWDDTKAEFGKGLLGDKSSEQVKELTRGVETLGDVARQTGEAFRALASWIGRTFDAMSSWEWSWHGGRLERLSASRARGDAADAQIAQLRSQLFPGRYDADGNALPERPGGSGIGTLAPAPVSDAVMRASAEDVARKERDAEVARLQAELKALEARGETGRALGALPSTYREGMTLGGLWTVRNLMSKSPIHHGSHAEPGTFDIRGSELERIRRQTGMSWARQQEALAAMGLIVAWRKAGDKGITNDHFHLVDPRYSPQEAERLRGQAQSNRRVMLPTADGAGTGRAAEIRRRLAELDGPGAMAELERDLVRQMAEERDRQTEDYIRILDAAIRAYDAGDSSQIDRLREGWGLGPDRASWVAELERAQRVQAERRGTPDLYETMASQAEDAQRRRQDAAEHDVRMAELQAAALRQVSDELRQQGGAYTDLVQSIQAVADAEREVITLRLEAARASGDARRVEQAEAEAELAEARLRQDVAGTLATVSQAQLRRDADTAAARAALADTDAEAEEWTDRRLQSLRQEANYLRARTGESLEYLRVLKEIRDIEEERERRYSRAAEVLQVSLGGSGALEAWTRRQRGDYGDVSGERAIDFDWSRLRTTAYRGDAPEGGLLQGVVDGVLAGMGAGTPAIAEAVREATLAGMQRVARGIT